MLKKIKVSLLIVGISWPIFTIAIKAVQFLGDLDTACGIAGEPTENCGSSAVVEFLADPEGWVVAIGVLVSLVSFYFYIKLELSDTAEIIKSQTCADVDTLQARLDELEARLEKCMTATQNLNEPHLMAAIQDTTARIERLEHLSPIETVEKTKR